jgi:hypothetical protein
MDHVIIAAMTSMRQLLNPGLENDDFDLLPHGTRVRVSQALTRGAILPQFFACICACVQVFAATIRYGRVVHSGWAVVFVVVPVLFIVAARTPSSSPSLIGLIITALTLLCGPL